MPIQISGYGVPPGELNSSNGISRGLGPTGGFPNWSMAAPNPDFQEQARWGAHYDTIKARAQSELAVQAAREMAQAKAAAFQSALSAMYGGMAQPVITAQAPSINAGPIWNQSQIQQQVNSARAGNDSATARQVANMNNNLASRGYGTTSPLAAALASQAQSANIATNADIDRSTRWGAAEGNAKNMLAGQKLQADVYSSQLQAQLQAAQIAASQQNAMMAALASMFS